MNLGQSAGGGLYMHEGGGVIRDSTVHRTITVMHNIPTIVQARRQLAIPEVKTYYFLFGFLFRLIPVVEANLHPRRKL